VVNVRERWGASALGRISAASLRSVGRRATLHVTSADRELELGQSCVRFADRLVRDAANGHVIVPFWSAHQMTIALLALEQFGLRRALAQFEVIADESCLTASDIPRLDGAVHGILLFRSTPVRKFTPPPAQALSPRRAIASVVGSEEASTGPAARWGVSELTNITR